MKARYMKCPAFVKPYSVSTHSNETTPTFYTCTIDIVRLCTNTSLPTWFSDVFKSKGLDKKYSTNAFLKQPFIQSDFNGDGKEDIAVLISETSSKRKGILVIQGMTNDYFIFGAGKDFGNGGDDFKWVDKWTLYKKKSVSETKFDKETDDIIGVKEIKLVRPAILIEDYEDGAAIAGGVIYWNGKKYIWIHQGE